MMRSQWIMAAKTIPNSLLCVRVLEERIRHWLPIRIMNRVTNDSRSTDSEVVDRVDFPEGRSHGITARTGNVAAGTRIMTTIEEELSHHPDLTISDRVQTRLLPLRRPEMQDHFR